MSNQNTTIVAMQSILWRVVFSSVEFIYLVCSLLLLYLLIHFDEYSFQKKRRDTLVADVTVVKIAQLKAAVQLV